MYRTAIALLLLVLPALADPLQLRSPIVRPQRLARYPHDPEAYTQGLCYCDPEHLWESTGLEGQSSLRQVRLRDGVVQRRQDFAAPLFAEGLTRLGEELFLLTYLNRRMLRCQRDFSAPQWRPYAREGWGLATSPEGQLVSSDGSDRLEWLDPETLEVQSYLELREGEQPIRNLNELEFVGPWLLANVYTTDWVVVIQPGQAQVVAWLDLRGLLSDSERSRAEVLNGLAYNPAKGTLYGTGKNWPWLFELALPAWLQ